MVCIFKQSSIIPTNVLVFLENLYVDLLKKYSNEGKISAIDVDLVF